MAEQNSQQGRKPHFHRGRRGQERRGTERRNPPASQEQQGRDGVDVEQIMRDIRTRIAQRHGIDLSTQQIQELAARRLEAILEPRNVTPALMEQLRRGAAEPIESTAPADGGYSFEDTTLYETHRGILRFFRRLLHPILKLFFNPTPLVHALNTQGRLNREAAARDAERDRRQAEWNALHYELVQRMVTEVSRVGIEMQNLSLRIESLSAKVDFNERRVRGMENVTAGGRPPRSEARGERPEREPREPRESREPREPREPRSEPRGDQRNEPRGESRPPDRGAEREPREAREPRPVEVRPAEAAVVAATVAAVDATNSSQPAEGAAPPPDGVRRKRRRRRGRRSGSGLAESASVTSGEAAVNGESDEPEGSESENGEADLAESGDDVPAVLEASVVDGTEAPQADSDSTASQGTSTPWQADAAESATQIPADTAFTAAAEPSALSSGATPFHTQVTSAVDPPRDERAVPQALEATPVEPPEEAAGWTSSAPASPASEQAPESTHHAEPDLPRPVPAWPDATGETTHNGAAATPSGGDAARGDAADGDVASATVAERPHPNLPPDDPAPSLPPGTADSGPQDR